MIAVSVISTVRRSAMPGLALASAAKVSSQSLQIADHAYVLEKGRVVQSGPGAALLADPRVRQAYLGLS